MGLAMLFALPVFERHGFQKWVRISFIANALVTPLIAFVYFYRLYLLEGILIILLNLAGVVSGKTLGRYRPWIVIGVFVFAAVATPSTDPFSMLMLAIPLQILFIVAEIVARLVDRARGRGADSTDQWDDDELSPM